MIIGGRVVKVTAQRLSNANFGGLAVNVNVTKMERSGDHMIISYVHHIDYKENVASMDIEGEILYKDSDSSLKELDEKWKKNGEIPKELAEDVINAVNHTGSAVGTLLSFAINIQAPVVTSKISISDSKPKGKAG